MLACSRKLVIEVRHMHIYAWKLVIEVFVTVLKKKKKKNMHIYTCSHWIGGGTDVKGNQY